jgi:hypothetical protein
LGGTSVVEVSQSAKNNNTDFRAWVAFRSSSFQRGGGQVIPQSPDQSVNGLLSANLSQCAGRIGLSVDPLRSAEPFREDPHGLGMPDLAKGPKDVRPPRFASFQNVGKDGHCPRIL